MDVLSTLLRLVLAAVFALAAGAKLLDPAGTRRALADFGVSATPGRVLARVVPAVETATAVGLLIEATTIAAAVVAAALMLAFGLAIARVLWNGRTADCNCFGQLSSAPVAWGALIRNALIGAGAVVVSVAGPGDAPPLWAIAAVAAATGALLVRASRVRRPVELVVGARAPAVDGLDRALEDGLPAALVFVSPGCGPCRELVPQLESWRGAMDGRLGLVTVENASAFGVATTPSAVIVAPDGSIASGTATGAVGVEELVLARLASASGAV
jgi:uncharacterized membrane protein YphA (DoxX/SURF4 family)